MNIKYVKYYVALLLYYYIFTFLIWLVYVG